MPMVNKVYIHKAGDILNLERVDNYFNSMPIYNNGQVCFSSFKDINSFANNIIAKFSELQQTFNIDAMQDKCYDTNFFYVQKDRVSNGMSFMLYYKPKYRIYEGLAGNKDSFKVVKDGAVTHNENSISKEDYSFVKFDTKKALIEIRDRCDNVNPMNGQCEDE